MDVLVVNLDDLNSTANTLTSLVNAFENSKDDADGVKPFLGSGELADTINSFATNWKDHKQKLMDMMTDVQKLVQQSYDAYNTTDCKLGDGLQSNPIPTAHKGGPQ